MMQGRFSFPLLILCPPMVVQTHIKVVNSCIALMTNILGPSINMQELEEEKKKKEQKRAQIKYLLLIYE